MSKYNHFEMCEKIFGQQCKWNEQKDSYEPYSRTDMWNKLIEQQEQIADLEAKLAESEKFMKDNDFKNLEELDNYIQKVHCHYDEIKNKGTCGLCEKLDNELIKELKQQLAEKEKEIDEVRSNHANIVADIAYKAVNVYTAESKETGVPTFYKIHYSQLLEIEDMNNLRNYAKDKISFAVDILEELADCSNYINSKLDFECGSYVSEKAIRDKIKYLKGKKDE